MIGDGGQSGFDVAIPSFRFHNFTGASPDVNFENGDFERWIWTGDPLQTGGEFYAPVIGDPVVSKTMFAGTNRTAYRTKTAGLGTRTIAEAQAVCNEWTGDFSAQCGDWAELGNVRLTDAAWGTSSRRQPGRDRADEGRRFDGVGRDVDRSRLRLEERQRRARRRDGCRAGAGHEARCDLGHLEPDRPTGAGYSGQVRHEHLRRSRQREPRLGLVQRLQRECAGRPPLRGARSTRPPVRRRGRTSITTGAISRLAISSTTT